MLDLPTVYKGTNKATPKINSCVCAKYVINPHQFMKLCTCACMHIAMCTCTSKQAVAFDALQQGTLSHAFSVSMEKIVSLN